MGKIVCDRHNIKNVLSNIHYDIFCDVTAYTRKGIQNYWMLLKAMIHIT